MNGAFNLLSPRRKIQEKMLLTLCFAVFHFPVQENMQIAFLWMLCHILVKVLWGSMHLAELSLVPAWRVGLFLLIETDFISWFPTCVSLHNVERESLQKTCLGLLVSVFHY